MLQKLGRAVSHRVRSLIEKMRDKRYRDGYVAAHTRQVLAKQMREFRGAVSQMEFATAIGKRQTMVSRLESPNYVGWTLSTMFEIARKLDVAVFVRFVDFATFLKLSEDMSESALHPRAYKQGDMDALLDEPEEKEETELEHATIVVNPTAFNYLAAANQAATAYNYATSVFNTVNQLALNFDVPAFAPRPEMAELQRERARDKKKIAELEKENRRLAERLARRESSALFMQEQQSVIEIPRDVQLLPAFIAATSQPPQGRML